MNNNAATGSYHDDLVVFGGDSNCGKKSATCGKTESRKSASSVSSATAAAAAAAAAAAVAAAGNPRLQQWLKETERQREENNRVAFARWMEKCDSGLVKPSTLQNYPTATAAALRAQPSGTSAAAAVAAAAAANKRHHQQMQQRPPSPSELDCGPDGSQFAAVLGNALLHHHSASGGGQQLSQQTSQMQQQQQQQIAQQQSQSQAMLDPSDCGPLGYPMYMYAAGYGPYQPATFCYQPAGPHHQQPAAPMPMHSQQQRGGYMSGMPQMQQQQHHHGYGLLHLGGPGGGSSSGGGRVCPQSASTLTVGDPTGSDQSQGPQGAGYYVGPEDSPEAAAAVAAAGVPGGPGDMQQHLCGDFSGMGICHVLQRQA